MYTSSHKRNKDYYCEYHEDYGHKTDDCNDLKREIEMCIQNGQLSQFVKDVRKTNYKRDREESRGETDNMKTAGHRKIVGSTTTSEEEVERKEKRSITHSDRMRR